LLPDAPYAARDSYATACALPAAIRQIGDVALILTGRQAADDAAGIVGLGIAELLRIPAVTFAADVRLAGGKLVVERALADATETVECTLPALVTVSHEVGAVRHPSLRETMKAARKPMQTWSPADLGLDACDVGARGARRVLERLYIPKSAVECDYVSGDTPEGIAAALVARLVEAKVI
jgi:electron transfer flavoprotein beta subunit